MTLYRDAAMVFLGTHHDAEESKRFITVVTKCDSSMFGEAVRLVLVVWYPLTRSGIPQFMIRGLVRKRLFLSSKTMRLARCLAGTDPPLSDELYRKAKSV